MAARGVSPAGHVPEGPGYVYPPTVLADVAPTAKIAREEIFGPGALVQTFATDDEALRAANDTPHGLAGYAFTADLDRALRLQQRLEIGMLGINSGTVADAAAPFGGINHSGFGREGIDGYLATHYAAIGLSAGNGVLRS